MVVPHEREADIASSEQINFTRFATNMVRLVFGILIVGN